VVVLQMEVIHILVELVLPLVQVAAVVLVEQVVMVLEILLVQVVLEKLSLILTPI
jgi:hypothetical protein